MRVSDKAYSLTLTSNDRFLKKIFQPILFTLRAFARNLLRGKLPKKYFFPFFLFIDTKLGFISNEPTHYLLDYADFILTIAGFTFFQYVSRSATQAKRVKSMTTNNSQKASNLLNIAVRVTVRL